MLKISPTGGNIGDGHVKGHVEDYPDTGFIKFLGTAGSRFVVARQLRASGGLWIRSGGTNVLVDPGPGTLVRCLSSRPILDPLTLDAIILTHKHLDHSGDVNVMIEAMTDGGRQRRGAVFAPADALGEDPVIFRYLRDFTDRIEVLAPQGLYRVGSLHFSTACLHEHRVETYGLNFDLPAGRLAVVADTLFFDELIEAYRSDFLVLNAVLLEQRRPKPIDHLCLEDARVLIERIKPKAAILTHFGLDMVRTGPSRQVSRMSEDLGVSVIAAEDGMTWPLPD